mmetsp:Transcript_10482/g.27352  ORF Transcript_10482/g.27352 Transcript_10482/m.27352 type:complete len:96 (+) Transcript_10482:1195-1482(+)
MQGWHVSGFTKIRAAVWRQNGLQPSFSWNVADFSDATLISLHGQGHHQVLPPVFTSNHIPTSSVAISALVPVIQEIKRLDLALCNSRSQPSVIPG